jgi:hypothetical protein
VSYTLRGRIESRVAAGLVPLAVACLLGVLLPAWWPVLLAALMLGVGAALDFLLYDNLDYQPGWYALPLGLVELGILMGLVQLLEIRAPLWAALVFFAGSWLVALVLGQAGFPLLRLSYAESGGELAVAGAGALGAVLALLVASGFVYWTKLPPTVHLRAGVHRGPIVIDHPQVLVAEPGAVVRGTIVVRSSHVILRNVRVQARGDYGIVVDDASHVLLDGVQVRGARLDGIHVRRSQVHIRGCTVVSPPGYTQGIDISFGMDRGMSVVERCSVRGGQEGIVTHSVMADLRRNVVRRTTLRGISMIEMSMGEVRDNVVSDTVGVGILCSDRSECAIEHNRVSDTRPDDASGDRARAGFGIEAHFEAVAELTKNDVGRNPRGVGAFAGARVVEEGQG